VRGKNSKISSDIYIWFKVCNQKYKSMIKDLHFHIWLNLPKDGRHFFYIFYGWSPIQILKKTLYCTKGPFITFLSTLFPILLLVNAFIYSLFSISLSLSLSLINSLILFLKLTKPSSLVLYPQNACVNLDLNCFIYWDAVFF
jgi:hypothetical protein